MSPKRPADGDDAPLPGAMMPLAEENRLVKPGNDNWSMRKKMPPQGAHYSDDDDHQQTIPV